jgi:predicted phosphodiesterase
VRVAALYDIHGNAPALDAVLDEVRRARVDRIVVGGDVLPGPMPREALDALAGIDIPTEYIVGNGDREVLAHRRGTGSLLPDSFLHLIAWSGQQLRPADVDRIASWPATLRVSIDGLGDVLFCHATPRNDVEIFFKTTPEDRLLPIFSGLGAPLAVCGHTHMPFDRLVGRVRVVNAGSVGMPFCGPGADWLLLGPGVERRHTTYDLHAAAERIRRCSYPNARDFADQYVLAPPTEEETLKLFALAELR